jgi:hypothetical protein
VAHFRWVSPALLAAVALAGCPAALGSPSRRVVVTANGRVGPLHVDQSDRADVIAFAGPPDSEVHGRYAPPYTPFDALGYGCAGTAATDRGGDPMCKTVFYLDAAGGKLELFYTEDERYSNLYGVHVGTTTARAEALMHRLVIGGCFDGLSVNTKTGFLVMWFEGGNDRVHRHPYYLHPVGGHVAFIVVHSLRLNPGVLDCIDS